MSGWAEKDDAAWNGSELIAAARARPRKLVAKFLISATPPAAGLRRRGSFFHRPLPCRLRSI